MRRFLYTVLFVACSLFASGQSIRHIGAAEGLNNPTVYSIVQDDWGFVWIGTRDGLYKYNEGRARSFPFLDSTDFRRSNNVQSLLVTQDSVLLIGLQLGGIMGVDLESLRPIPDNKIPQLPREVSIISLHQDSEGTIWAGSSGSGIFQLRLGSEDWERFVSDEYAEDLKFIFDFEDQGDTLWIATSGDHLLYYLKSQSSVYALEANKSVSSFRKSVDVSGGKVIFSVEGTGVFELTGDVFYELAIPTKGTQRDAIFYEGNVWISTDGYGVYQWNGSTAQHFTKQDPTSGIITDQFYGIYEVYDALWLGTYNGGIAQFPVKSSAVSLLPKPKKFVASSIQSAISMVSDNDLWVGFDGDGLVRYRETESIWQPTTFDNPFLPDVVTSLEFYQDELWIGSLGQGLFVMDTSGTIKEHFLAYSQSSRGLENSNIWSLEKTWGDSLWIGTLYGLQFWDGVEITSPFDTPWRVGRNIMDLEFDGDLLWVGTEFQGIYTLSRQGAIQSIPIKNSVLDIETYSNYKLVGTEGSGVLVIDEGRVIDTIIGKESFVNCYSISEKKGRVYAATSVGLLEIKINDQLEWSYEVFKELDELQVGLSNRKALLWNGERLLLGGTQGVVEISTEDSSAAAIPPILITGVFADNLPKAIPIIKDGVSSAQTVVFAAGTKSVRFNFELASNTLRNGISNAYRIKALGDYWVELPYGTRTIDLQELPPGKYLLEVRSLGANAVEKTVLITFRIKSFLIQRSWFRVLIFVVFIFLIGTAVSFYQERKYRSTRLKLVETERELLKAKASELEVKSNQQKTELSFQLLKTSSRLELLHSFKERLESESKQKNRSDEVLIFLKSMTREINRELQSENYWDHFERNYRELHEEFSRRLVKQFPKLTKGEVRLCYLIRQKMSNKEIATVLNVSPAAIEKAKYRLKKKIVLDKEDALDEYIQGL